MNGLQLLTNILARLNIRIPEFFLKEEIIRILAESSTERIIENPLVLQSIPKEKKIILDVGCRYSLLPIQLATLGHSTYGIDVNDYRRKHPKFKFFKADILKSPFKINFFDIVISLSTLEHIGFGRYGEDKNTKGDIETVREINRILKRKGQFVVTLPFGKEGDTKWYRVYNKKRIVDLLKDFQVVEERTFKEKNGYWVSCKTSDAEKVDSSNKARAMIYLKAVKK